MLPLLLLLAAAQDASVERLLLRLESDSLEERTRAEAELLARGQASLEPIARAFKSSGDPDTRRRLLGAAEILMGRPAVTPERVKAARVSFAGRAAELGPLLAEFRKQAGLPIQLDPKSSPILGLPDPGLKDAPLDAALDAVTRAAGGFWFADGDRILVVTPEKMPVRLFDVRDLTGFVWDDRWTPIGPQEEEPEPGREAKDLLTGQDIAALVRGGVRRDDWDEREGKSVQFSVGHLVVRHSPATLQEIDRFLRELRGAALADLRIEIEAFAARPGTEPDLDALRRTGKVVALFRRHTRADRRVAFSAGTRLSLATRRDAEGRPVFETLVPGAKMNVRVSPADDGARMRVELAAGFSRILSAEKKDGLEIPTIASHTIRVAETVAAGKPAFLGRIAETRIEEGLGDILIFGRFSAGERP